MKTPFSRPQFTETASSVQDPEMEFDPEDEWVPPPPERATETTVRDDELILMYPTGKDFWYNDETTEFAARFRGANRDYSASLVNQSLAVPVLTRSAEGHIKHLGPEELYLAVTKAFSFALMYPNLTFLLSDLAFPKKLPLIADDLIFELRGCPSNVFMPGHWKNLSEEQMRTPKSARLVISGSAVGVNDSFVLDEIEAEVEYLRDQGYTDITLLNFGLYGIGNSRGDIRIPVCCAKVMKSHNVKFVRATFDRDKFINVPPSFYAFFNAQVATHILHFQPVSTRGIFDFMGYYNSKQIESRELLLVNQQAKSL